MGIQIHAQASVKAYTIECSNNSCYGTYKGKEFINAQDVAHQFSKHRANKVGDHLKSLFKKGYYVRIDLKHVKMSTLNMGNKGDVIYKLVIPFEKVDKPCEARTSFDHRGGWGHQITKESVLNTFGKLNGLELSEKNTQEGLQEFWIQWRHSGTQVGCNH
ncbi:MAG: hypothetical protein ACI860_001743 [Chitinophagales bacterium]|jgi:hypothetical protein